MTRDDIIRMAEEAGCGSIPKSNGVFVPAHNIERFAALVAAHEREECAKVCEGRIGGAVDTNEWWNGFKASMMKQCAAAIRARSQQ